MQPRASQEQCVQNNSSTAGFQAKHSSSFPLNEDSALEELSHPVGARLTATVALGYSSEVEEGKHPSPLLAANMK